MQPFRGLLLVAVLALAGQAAAHDQKPELPFPHEQDPLQCGIPEPIGSGVPGMVVGMHEGELVEPEVHLYDSHLMADVIAHVPHGTEVSVMMYQDNPVLDFYYIVVATAEGVVRGWVPGPFVEL